MRCPRCGLVNTPNIIACARCGLPVTQSALPSSGGYQQPPPPEPSRQAEHPQQEQPQTQTHGAYPFQSQPGQPGPFQGQPGQPGPGPWGYGQPTQPAYQQGSAPYTSSLTTAPATSPSTTKSTGSKAAIGVTIVGALLSLGYAAWAFTARRGIFKDFADGNLVTTDDAQSNDNLDTTFLLIAGIVAVIALLVLTRELLNRAAGTGRAKLIGLIVGVVGAVIVSIGLLLANSVANPGSQVEQGAKGVTATLVIGGGFVLMALGLLIGAVGIAGTHRKAGYR